MLTNENARAAVASAEPGAKQTSDATNFTPFKPLGKALPKRVRVLGALLAGRSLNRFDAARFPDVADSCLNSTVAELEGDGIRIDRVDEIVLGRHGPARVKRYSLNTSGENVARVRAMLGLQPEGGQHTTS